MSGITEYLSHLTDIDTTAAEHTRDKLLDANEIPPGWSVYDTTVEPSEDDTGDWFLAGLQNETTPDRTAALYLLAGSHSIQVYIESACIDEWTDPFVFS